MAHRRREPPETSVTTFLAGVTYPVSRQELEQSAMDSNAPTDVINTLKALPRDSYDSRDAVFRDLAEAGRRFGMGNIHVDVDDHARRDRRNIGKDTVEGASPPFTRHP